MRRAALVAAGLAVAAVLLGPAAGGAAPGDAVTLRDPKGDVVASGLDITRVSLQVASDGKLRAAVTLRRDVTVEDLAAPAPGSGPLGGLCVRLWTAGQRPSSDLPDHLVCTSTSKGAPKVSVFRTRPGDLPVRIAGGSFSRASARSLVLRFAQSSIGRPARLRFGVEATRPGCPRTSCIDTAPDAPRSAAFVIRASSKEAGGGDTAP